MGPRPHRSLEQLHPPTQRVEDQCGGCGDHLFKDHLDNFWCDGCDPYPNYIEPCVLLSNDSTVLMKVFTSDPEQAYNVFRAYVGPDCMFFDQNEEWLGMTLPYEVTAPFIATNDRSVEVIGYGCIMVVGVDTYREGMADILYHIIQSYATCKVFTRDGEEWRRDCIPNQLWVIPLV